MAQLSNSHARVAKLFIPILLVLVGVTWAEVSSAEANSGRTFCIDPARGHQDNDGSPEHPWRTLQEVIEGKRIETQTYVAPYKKGGPLVAKNPGAPVKAGDTLLLYSGHHGEFRLSGAINKETITVKAASGERPTLSRVYLTTISRWRLEGLTVHPPQNAESATYNLIRVNSHGWQGPSSEVTVADCNVYSATDTSTWTKEQWNHLACSGIALHGNQMVIENNHIKNINFGLSIDGNHGRASGNTVENFAGDGMRGLGNDLLFEYNTVKNCYNVNENHDDGFQSWSIKDDPPRERVTLRGNTIINYEDPNQSLRGPLQGIGCFDGPYIDWVVENNLIIVDHYHGIAFYGAYNCRIVNNTIADHDTLKPGPPWIAIHPHKNKTPSENCLIRNNIVPEIIISPGVTEDHNYRLRHVKRLFRDPTTFDFYLKPDAIVIDAGVLEFAPAIDRDGTPRPQGKGIDMGAYEYIPD